MLSGQPGIQNNRRKIDFGVRPSLPLSPSRVSIDSKNYNHFRLSNLFLPFREIDGDRQSRMRNESKTKLSSALAVATLLEKVLRFPVNSTKTTHGIFITVFS